MAGRQVSHGIRVGRMLHADAHNPQGCQPDSSAQCGHRPRNKGRSATARHLQFCTERALLRPGARKQPVKWASQQTPKPDLFPGPDPKTKVPEGSRRSLSPFPPPTSPH